MPKPKQQYNALAEFVKILLKYMDKFGLEAIDIAFLANSTRINIENLINLSGSLELERMDAIAQSFNLHYYQFGNPLQAIPDETALPERTRQRITLRKESGPYIPETRNSTTMNNKIAIALSFLNINDEFSTKHIAEIINTVDADTTFSASLVGDRLAKKFSLYTEKTNKLVIEGKRAGAKAYYFKVSMNIPESELNKSIELVGKYWYENYKKMMG